MIWSIDMDDAKGTCMGINYPLINSGNLQDFLNLKKNSFNYLFLIKTL